MPSEEGRILLGDLVVCAEVIRLEAHQQGKTIQSHFAHMVIHGILHLLGYDHVSDDQAAEMEQLEIQILRLMKIADPYSETTALEECDQKDKK